MSNPFTDVRNAAWALLDAHEGLTAFLAAREGTKYRFGDSENLPLRLGADDCPALAVSPLLGAVKWESTSARAVLYRVEIRGYADSTKVEEIEEFAYLVYDALVAGLPDFAVAAVEGIEFVGPAFTTYRTGGARFCEFTLGVAARIHSEATA
jgi:hypothetical protein